MSVKDFFFQHIKFKVGNGERVLFWHDVWAADTLLAVCFPDLFSCAS